MTSCGFDGSLLHKDYLLLLLLLLLQHAGSLKYWGICCEKYFSNDNRHNSLHLT